MNSEDGEFKEDCGWFENSWTWTYTMTKIFEKAYAMSRQKPLLISRLIFPVSSSTATVAAMQAHTS